MKQNLGAKPFMYPMPVLIIATYNDDGSANAMNAAWGNISDFTKISISLTPTHKTVKNILKRKAFTVSMAVASEVVAADFVGVVSGNKVENKVKKAGWTLQKSQLVDAPVINELPLTLECVLESFDDKTDIVVGEIKNVLADDCILTDGNIDLSKFKPICYDPANHAYVTLGEKVGNAFSDGKKLVQ